MTDFALDTLTESQRYVMQFLDSGLHKMACPFVREHGRFFKPSPLPKGIRTGNLTVCFANSYRLLRRHGKRLGLACSEGYAMSRHLKAAHLHAWCVDRHGTVYDPTWNIGFAYFGIPFKSDYVISTIKQRESSGDLYYGLIDDWANGYPLIKKLGNRPDYWKHQWEGYEE